MSGTPDSEKRVAIEFYEDVSDEDRREIIRMVRRALDGDAVFAIEDYDWQPGDTEKVERFIENELRGGGTTPNDDLRELVERWQLRHDDAITQFEKAAWGTAIEELEELIE